MDNWSIKGNPRVIT